MKRMIFWGILIAGVAFVYGCKGSSSTGGTIFGKIQEYGSGKPMVGAEVKVYSKEGVELTATANENGNYTISNIPAGSYKVRAYHQGYHLAETMEEVEVKKGKKEVNLQLAVVGGGT
jgi:uncharacterized protein YfaS (alpha-2-macroglobulin family)